MFLGRKKEINILEMKYNSNKKEFGVIYGRRRIGKSSILTNFLKDKNCIFFQAKKDNAFGNLKSFSYAIADQYDAKKDINYIWLHIKYKDLEFDAYTNFTFPKDGDPGTNGTDYVAKIVPSTNTDRIYISDKAPTTIFDDNGATVANLKF